MQGLAAQVIKPLRFIRDQRILRNIFKSKSKRRALLSYLTHPFLREDDYSHNHNLESRLIAECLRERGYMIDVIHWNCRRALTFSDYELIIGLGECVERACASENTPAILSYATGSAPDFQNNASLKRLNDYTVTEQAQLQASLRLAKKWPRSLTKADALAVIGNNVTAASYHEITKIPIQTLPVPAYIVTDLKQIETRARSKNELLYISSGGFLHKGLDLVLKAATKFQDCQFHIAAPLEQELGFSKILQKELDQLNIHTHGFVSLESPLFKSLVEHCSFVILPSCAEGQSAAVVNAAINGQLIPIISRETGIDTEDCIVVEQLSQTVLEQALEQALQLTTEEIAVRARRIRQRLLRTNSEAAFTTRLNKAIDLALIQHETKS